MDLAERFPKSVKVLRLIALTFGGLVIMIIIFIPLASMEHMSDPGDLQRWSIDRLFVILFLAGIAIGLGAVLGDAALPEAILPPAVLVATVTSIMGLWLVVMDVRDFGWIPLQWFIFGIVCPPAFVLGALVQQRLRKRWPKKERS